MDGKSVIVPDFYKEEYPDLYKVEIRKQVHKSHMSKLGIQESNVNYFNRHRPFKAMINEIQEKRRGDSDNEDSGKTVVTRKRTDKDKDHKK